MPPVGWRSVILPFRKLSRVKSVTARLFRQCVAENPPGLYEIVIGDHQTAWQYAQTAVHNAHVTVENYGFDPGVDQQHACKIEQNGVVGLQNLAHNPTSPLARRPVPA